jgi:Melibiase.
MGFNNWARFGCDLNETLFAETVQTMLKRGLDVGYDRLRLDDCWMLHDRAEDGSLEWDTDKFPHGIPGSPTTRKAMASTSAFTKIPATRPAVATQAHTGTRCRMPNYSLAGASTTSS